MELDLNETHVMLHVLDDKLEALVADNKSMQVFIDEKTAQLDVTSRRQNAIGVVQSYMETLRQIQTA